MIMMAMLTVLAAVLFAAGCCCGGAGSADRQGVVTMRGKPLTLVGPQLQAGDAAPSFTAVAADLSTYHFAPGDGKTWIISAVPSVDTPVCSIQTKRFNDEAARLAPKVGVIAISMDLPFAQKRWCAAEGAKNLQVVSDYRDRAFGLAYGVYIKENGLLARSVFVVGPDGRLALVHIVPELTSEPDYDTVLAAAKKAAGL